MRCYLARLNEPLPSAAHLMSSPRASSGSVLLPSRYFIVCCTFFLWFAGILAIEPLVIWPSHHHQVMMTSPSWSLNKFFHVTSALKELHWLSLSRESCTISSVYIRQAQQYLTVCPLSSQPAADTDWGRRTLQTMFSQERSAIWRAWFVLLGSICL